MKNRSRILFLLALCSALVLCASCVREVVMDAGEKPVVVVECVISNNPVQTLHLRYTKGASKTDYEVVTEADAVLLSASGTALLDAEGNLLQTAYTAQYSLDEIVYQMDVTSNISKGVVVTLDADLSAIPASCPAILVAFL